MFTRIKNFVRNIFMIPSYITILLYTCVKTIKYYRNGIDVLDAENKDYLDNIKREIYIDFEKYQVHINWITWIIIALLFIR